LQKSPEKPPDIDPAPDRKVMHDPVTIWLKWPLAAHRKRKRMVRDDNPAKVAIIQEWDVWSKTHADNTGGLLFFQHLQHRRPDIARLQDTRR
jgi:hypothetical protein